MEMPTPNANVLSKKAHIVKRLNKILPAESVIFEEHETRAYECDALTAYRCLPMIAVLPETTQQVSDVLRVCYEEGVPVVPRGSGTSLAGGAMPTADCVILGVAKLNNVLETDYDNRLIRVQSGRTNLSVSGAVEEDGFFYAPDPSSQLPRNWPTYVFLRLSVVCARAKKWCVKKSLRARHCQANWPTVPAANLSAVRYS